MEKIQLTLTTSHSIQRQISKESTIDIPIEIYYESLPFSPKIPIIEDFKMLFGFNQISSNAEQVINSWINAYGRIDPTLNLFFSTRTGGYKFISGRFLALAQCLESYHRRTSDKVYMDIKAYEELIKTTLENIPEDNKSWLNEKLKYGYELNLTKGGADKKLDFSMMLPQDSSDTQEGSILPMTS